MIKQNIYFSFKNSAIKGQQKANEMLDFVDDMKDLLAYANLTKN